MDVRQFEGLLYNMLLEPDNEPTSSLSYFIENPIVNVETIEEMFKDMKVHRVQQKGDKTLSHEYEKYRIVQQKKGNQHSPGSHLQIL